MRPEIWQIEEPHRNQHEQHRDSDFDAQWQQCLEVREAVRLSLFCDWRRIGLIQPWEWRNCPFPQLAVHIYDGTGRVGVVRDAEFRLDGIEDGTVALDT